VPSAALAAQADVRAEAVHEPFVAAARVRSTQSNDIAEPELDDGAISGRHRSRPVLSEKARAP
jgi:uncharacterized protein (DUF2252 family)